MDEQETESGRTLSGAVYDVVGIGFGPANLALAIAIDEHNRSVEPAGQVSYVFVEKQTKFGWHKGMLIEDAQMQISFLKDLVTLRNPVSDLSFVSFLADNDRLVDFTNHQRLFPSRLEFHRYLEWASARIAGDVRYGSLVTDVRPVVEDGDVVALDVVATTEDGSGTDAVFRGRNVVVATGLTPSMPAAMSESDRIWHNGQLMDRLSSETVRSASKFMVVGAGQSAAETVECLHRRFPEAEVHSVFSRFGFSPADDSPFANGIFDPATVPVFFNAPAEIKEMLLDYHRNTNYSVVDTDLIRSLYASHYQEKVSGQRRLHLLNMSKVTAVLPGYDSVQVEVQYLPSGDVTSVDVDVLVYATGYRPADPLRVLGQAAELCKCDSENRLRTELNYRVATAANVRCGIYVQGPTEHSHGLASSLLSNVAVRAGDILSSLLAERVSSESLEAFSSHG
ncbi:SidA/IucD/PvdA family monooxygenase [Lentzea sp. NPDC034063]|uniref:lysine N(6)-hydroxylase/L-ornithine N(5)-oxygenase family protein n=1 Tax=unclassified Lentzea TaxID=2643253 RepID=UPI0033C93D1E